MKILLLGIGMQGKAALWDLARDPNVSSITAADTDCSAIEEVIAKNGYGDKVRPMTLDARSEASLNELMAGDENVAIDLLPPAFVAKVAAAAIRQGKPLVNTFYATPEVKALDAEAKAKGVAILPEFGMDPGIDLVLMGEAVRAVHKVEEVFSYGAGFPEPTAADNAIKYKVTWSFEGVLRSYLRAGKVVRDGATVDIPADGMFLPENTHALDIEGLGRLEAFPNGDATKYIGPLQLERASLKNMGRYVLRWPGHCAFWGTMARLGLLNDAPVIVDGVAVERLKFLNAALKDQLQYKNDERDVAVIRLDVRGRDRRGKPIRAVYQAIDRRDLKTGFTAMNRTVGFTAAIGARMLVDGRVRGRGLLSPINDVSYAELKREWSRRDIQVSEKVTAG